MRAILVVTRDCLGLEVLHTRLAEPFVPIVDRPLLRHAVEHLIGNGVTTFDVIHAPGDRFAVGVLGDGERWGATVRHHPARDESHPYEALGSLLPAGGGDRVLFGHADRLPAGLGRAPSAGGHGPVLFCLPGSGGARPEWTGWAWIAREDVRGLPGDADEGVLANRLFAGATRAGVVETAGLTRLASYEGILAAHRDAISDRGPRFLFTSREIRPHVWVSRNVDLHPSARLVAPVFVGPGCRVGEGVCLGPNAVLGANCFVDRGSTVADSVVLPSSYVGKGVEVLGAIVDRDFLVNVRQSDGMVVDDPLILADVSGPLPWRFDRLAGRLAVAAALAVAWPALIATAAVLKLAGSPRALTSVEVVALPIAPARARWRTYRLWRFAAPGGAPGDDAEAGLWAAALFRVLPGLINVALGDLALVGVAPPSPAELRSMREVQRANLVRRKAGLVDFSGQTRAANPAGLPPPCRSGLRERLRSLATHFDRFGRRASRDAT